jgi:hypothetical protein
VRTQAKRELVRFIELTTAAEAKTTTSQGAR